MDQAENGQQAVDMALRAIRVGRPYSSILLDFEMPLLSGPLAAVELRTHSCDCFIAGITGNLLQEDVNYFKSCGAKAVLPKLVVLEDLKLLWMENAVMG